jgi:hypothetical protein
MKKHIILIIMVLILAVLSWPNPADAGKVACPPASNTHALKFSLGLRIDSESISLDGIFALDGGTALAKDDDSAPHTLTDGRTDDRSQSCVVFNRSTHRVRLGHVPNIVKRAHQAYVTMRALHHAARCVTRHWLSGRPWKRNN